MMTDSTTPSGDSTTTVQMQHDTDAQDHLAWTIVQAVSKVTGTDPLDLPTLYETIDVDSLERLFQTPPAATGKSVDVAFDYAGCRVTITPEATVIVAPLANDEATLDE